MGKLIILYYLKKGQHKNFDQIIRANIGDCHATGQKPMTFIRQVRIHIFQFNH